MAERVDSDAEVMRLRHDLSCRDPLLTCMALVSVAEQAHAAGCQTPPLAPMVMHFVNTVATEHRVSLPSEGGGLNWWRNVRLELDHQIAQAADMLSPLVNRCCRQLSVAVARTQDKESTSMRVKLFLDLASKHAPGLTALSLRLRTTAPLRLPPFAQLTSLSLFNVSVALETVATSAPSLTQLDLYGCSDVDLSYLACMPKLRKLILYRMSSDDVNLEVLDMCPSLTELAIGDPTSLAALPRLRHQLKVLEISNGSDWETLEMPKLERVALLNPSEEDLQRLAQRDGVLQHELSFSSFVDPVKLLPLLITKLQFCIFDSLMQSFDVTPLGAMPFLRHLQVVFQLFDEGRRYAVVGSLRGSAASASLIRIQLSHVTATAFSDGLFAVPALTDLEISDSPKLEAVSCLELCPALTALTLDKCGDTDVALAGLRHARRLRHLRIMSMKSVAPDVSVFASCAALESVKYSSTTEQYREVDVELPVQCLHHRWYQQDKFSLTEA